jgi:uridine phosphorylase
MILKESELILNPDGSIYHLGVLPENIANKIITVGDPDRVKNVTKHFDSIEFEVQKREFKTVTGTYEGKRISVVSTGIGTDNIDIVLNELDALVNINFSTRTVNKIHKSLDIIRIGTSGSIQKNISVDTFLLSELAVGFDNLIHFYKGNKIQHTDISKELIKYTNWPPENSNPYVISCDENLASFFKSTKVINGFTATNSGFYGPQGRSLRLELNNNKFIKQLSSFNYLGNKITNLEMETAGIYSLAKLLGHRAISMNAILANRITGEFSKNPDKLVDDLIVYCLRNLVF